MIKALIWKEYREIRLSLALIVLSCSILSWVMVFLYNIQDSYYVPTGWSSIHNNLGVLLTLTYVFMVSMIVLYTIMAGAEAFASEYQAKTFDFLISRTVSRKTLWCSKLGLRISTLLFPISYFILIDRFLLTPEQVNIQHQCIFAASVVFVFSTSFFFSTILNRPVKAGATGLIVYLGYAMLFFRFFDSYIIFSITCTILAILILMASFFVFTKNKLLCAV